MARAQAEMTGRDRSAGAPVARGADAGEELATRIRVVVTRLNRRLRQQSLAGLSPAQASALGAASRLGDPTLGELAAAEQVQPPSMTRIVSTMEQAGLLVRRYDEDDRRVCRVRLTADGRRTLQRVRSLKNAFLSKRLAALSPAERTSIEKLMPVLERLVTDERDP